jgi:hypothetical protein
LQKMLIWPQNFFFQTFSIWVSKNAIDADFESVEKVSRKFPRRKLEGWELLYTVLKDGKVHNFYTFMLITFLYEFFLHFFQWIWNQHPILHFFIPIKKCCEKNIWGGHISTFYQLWILTHTKRPKKLKIFFLKRESE